MSKRYTHLNRWKDPWFRSLSLQAKLLWIYINDECDSMGILVPDFDVASIRLCFDITPTVLPQWYGKNIFKIDDQRFLVVPFFWEQYGEAKDTWSAKTQAKIKLERLGFIIEFGKVKDPYQFFCPPPSPHSGTTPLNTDIDTDININKSSEAKKRVGNRQMAEHLKTLEEAKARSSGDISKLPPEVQQQISSFLNKNTLKEEKCQPQTK